jgi:biopolymer transport protein ExbD
VNQPPPDEPVGNFTPAPPQKPASMARYKRELRREIRRKALEPEINFLNITAMLDMMTMILVFLLKSLSTSTASLPQSKDLTLPISPLSTDSTEEPNGLAIVVTTHQLMFGDKNTVVCELPSQDSDKRNGIDQRYKDSSRNDTVIRALATKIKDWRDADLAKRQADPTHPDPLSEAIIIADESTPFRILFEVTNTLGQSGFGKFHLMVLQSGGTK